MAAAAAGARAAARAMAAALAAAVTGTTRGASPAFKERHQGRENAASVQKHLCLSSEAAAAGCRYFIPAQGKALPLPPPPPPQKQKRTIATIPWSNGRCFCTSVASLQRPAVAAEAEAPVAEAPAEGPEWGPEEEGPGEAKRAQEGRVECTALRDGAQAEVARGPRCEEAGRGGAWRGALRVRATLR